MEMLDSLSLKYSALLQMDETEDIPKKGTSEFSLYTNPIHFDNTEDFASSFRLTVELNLADTFCEMSCLYWCFYVLASTKEKEGKEVRHIKLYLHCNKNNFYSGTTF